MLQRRVECAEFFLGTSRVPDQKQNLPQLYRFCFLMLGDLRKDDVAPEAALQIEQLEPTQLAVWISNAPDPQRAALALFYLDEFDCREILELAELKLSELSRLLAQGRRQLQAWLDAKHPEAHKV